MTDTENTPIGDPDDVGDDFADEHSSATFADEEDPEGEPEPESPAGYAGMD